MLKELEGSHLSLLASPALAKEKFILLSFPPLFDSS